MSFCPGLPAYFANRNRTKLFGLTEKLQASVAPGLAGEGKALRVFALGHIDYQQKLPTLSSSQSWQETLTFNQLL